MIFARSYLCFADGSQISGADMIERPSHLGRVALVFGIPDSTSNAEKTPKAAEKSDERPRQLAHLGYLFGGHDHPGGEFSARNSPTECRFGRSASVMCPVALFILEQHKPMASQ